MWINLFDRDEFTDGAEIKIVVSLETDDLVKQVKQGEMLMTEWLHSGATGAEFRVIVQGRRIGVNNDKIIDGFRKDGGIWLPH